MRKLFLYLLISLSAVAFADNPLVKDIGMSDPHIRVFNDTVYLFCGHDDSPDDNPWVMKEWRVFRSTDLIDWEQVSTISTKDNYMPDDSEECWAGDAIQRNGKTYFYFSHQKHSIGVMQADKPDGHYLDALGKPLVAPMHDPTILIDDDKAKTPYMVYGDKAGEYHVVRLNDDMISVAEEPKPIVINGKEWENAPEWMDKNYIFKHNDTYYLSWGRDYAVAKNIYGPYECVGAVGYGHDLDEYAHGSFFHYKGQFYHDWCYYIRKGYKYRETIMTYCHMADNGEIVTDTEFLDKHYETGVGQYSATWDIIEAEWFSSKSEEVEKKGSRESGFRLAGIKNKSFVHFANVDFSEKQIKTLTLALNNIKRGTQISVRKDSKDGEEIAWIKIKKATLKDGTHKVQLDLKNLDDKNDIYIVFKGCGNNLCELDFLKFN